MSKLELSSYPRMYCNEYNANKLHKLSMHGYDIKAMIYINDGQDLGKDKGPGIVVIYPYGNTDFVSLTHSNGSWLRERLLQSIFYFAEAKKALAFNKENPTPIKDM